MSLNYRKAKLRWIQPHIQHQSVRPTLRVDVCMIRPQRPSIGQWPVCRSAAGWLPVTEQQLQSIRPLSRKQACHLLLVCAWHLTIVTLMRLAAATTKRAYCPLCSMHLVFSVGLHHLVPFIMSPLRRHIFVCFMAKSAFWRGFSALAPYTGVGRI